MFRGVFHVVAAAALLTAGAGWAAASSQRSANVTLTTPTVVAGKVMPAGDYHFRWTPGSAQVDVRVEERGGKHVVTEVRAKVQERPKAYGDDELVVRTAASGKQVLEELRLAGHKAVLVFPAA
jgi:hypothetical protein